MTIRLNIRQSIVLLIGLLAMYYAYKSSQIQSVQYPIMLKTTVDSTFTIRPL
jgi:hypothetical protein